MDAEASLAAFVQQGWHILHPTRPLEWSWYHDLICGHLERVFRGEISELLICIPPGFAKSMLVSVYWTAWCWLQEPGLQFLTLSSADEVARRDSRRMRDVITSPWFKRIRAVLAERDEIAPWGLSSAQNAKDNFVNSATGHRICFATGGSITGHRGDIQIIDDPHQIKDVLGSIESVANALGKAHEKVDVILPTRYNDRRNARRVTILQRVHQEDVAAKQIADPEVVKVILPMHAFEMDDPERHPEDPRAPGELLDPVFMPEEKVQREAAKLESQAPGQARAQHEMRPVPPGGGTFKRHWARYYDEDPQRPDKRYDEVITTVDATFKKSATSAFVSIQTWGRYGWHTYRLLDEVHARMDYVETRTACDTAVRKWRSDGLLIELKANGEALVNELRGSVPCPVIGFMPDQYGDKEARAQLCQPQWQGGGVELPVARWCPWITDWQNEVHAFPGATVRDRVDAKSQLFLWWKERRGTGSAAEVARGSDAVLAALGL